MYTFRVHETYCSIHIKIAIYARTHDSDDFLEIKRALLKRNCSLYRINYKSNDRTESLNNNLIIPSSK